MDNDLIRLKSALEAKFKDRFKLPHIKFGVGGPLTILVAVVALVIIFYNFFFVLYLVSPRTAHRVTGYFEEEAVRSYAEYLAGVDSGTHDNVPAPRIAIDYWKLAPDARLRDVIVAVQADEAIHRDVNHRFADELA